MSRKLEETTDVVPDLFGGGGADIDIFNTFAASPSPASPLHGGLSANHPPPNHPQLHQQSHPPAAATAFFDQLAAPSSSSSPSNPSVHTEMTTPHDLFNGPPQQDDIFGNSNQQHEEDASSLFGGSAASGPSFFDQLATPPIGHNDFPGGGSNFYNTPTPPAAKMVSPSSFTTPAQPYAQMQPSSAPSPQQFDSFGSAEPPPSHLGMQATQQSPAGPQLHQATAAPATTPAAAAPPPASPTHSAAASPSPASNSGNFNQFSTPAPQQNGEELPADIFASSGDAFFDSLGGPSAIASSPANDFFASAAQQHQQQHQQPSPFSPSHPIAAPSQPSTHAHLSSSPSPAAATSYASSPSAPSSSHSAQPGGGAYPSATHQHPATQYGSPGGPQQSYQPQAPHQQQYAHQQHQQQHPQHSHQQHPASSQYPHPHQHTQPGASEAAPYGQPHHPYGSVPSPATGGIGAPSPFNVAAGAGGPMSVFTPVMAQAPGSQGRSTVPAQQHPAGGINPYPQPPATAPVPFMGRGPAGGAGPGYPTPPGSSGGAAAPSATGAGSVAFNLGNGPQVSAGGFQPSATPTPPGTGGTGQFTTFVPRPAQPVGQPTPAGSSPYSGAPSPYATDSYQSPVGPGSSIPLNRLSTSASALPQKPQVDPYGRTMLTQSSPAPQPGPGGYLQATAGGQPGSYQAQGYGPYSPHQNQGQHHRNRSVSLQPNPQQLSDMPRVASNPEFARYGVMSPPGSGVPAHLAHNLSYLNSMPAMPPSMGNPQYGYPGGQPDNGYDGPYGGQQLQPHGGYGGQQAGWGDTSSPPMGQYAPSPYGMQQQPQDRLLFDRPHAVATFGFGGKLFTLIPRRKRKLNVYQPSGPEVDPQSDELLQGPLKIMPVHEVLGKTSFMTTFTSFPGPLKNASKDAVNKYVSNKASGASESEDAMADPEATQLLWSLLRVMCTHYGDLSQQDALKEVRQALLEGINPSDYNAASAAASSPLSGPALEAPVKQVEQLLLSGEREKACHVAMEAGLWGHALFLASHLNPQLYQTVCKRFAQSSISEGSPLQTLYLLLAKCPQEMLKSLQGSGGSSGTAVDRWRENLAVILANRMQGDVKVIGQLGDMLWSTQMRVAAAHFCYLVAETPFGPFENPNTRLILIGGDHKTQARLFVSPESVQRTEVFEYAKALGNSQYTLPSFQVYKFIYAATLADLGLLQQASNYYQSISAVVKDHAGTCSPAFLAQLHAFGDRISTIAPASRTAALAPPGWLSGLVQKGLSALIGDEKSSPAAGGAAASTEKIDVQASATVSAAGPASVPIVSVVTGGSGGQQPGIPSVAGPSPVMYNPSTTAATTTMMNPASMPMMNPASVPMMMNPSSASSSPYHQPQPGMHNPAAAHFGAPGGAPDFNGVSYHSQQQPQPADDYEEEDLMKSAFTKPKPSEESRPGAPSSVSMDKNGGSAQANGGQKDKPAEDKSGGDASGAGFWGRLGGLGLFRKKPTGKEMKLGQTENEFVYNEELGIWHEKGKPPPKEERGHSAPPPIMGAGPSGSGSPFPSSGGYPSGPAPLGPDGGNQFTKYASPARGNRRYVDTFNPEPAPGSAPSAPMSVPTPTLMMPTPGMHPASPATSAYTVFTPPMSPYQPQQ